MTPEIPIQAPIQVLIVDDEPTARRGVRLLLQQQPDLVVVGEAGNVPEAVDLVRKHRPDLVLLDIQMPQGDGFELVRALEPKEMPVIIFVTAFDEYALKAFEVNAIDYLLKPFEDARFHAAINRARDAVRQRQAEAFASRLTRLLHFLESNSAGAPPPEQPVQEPFSDRILVKSSGEIFFLKAEEIDWIEAEGDYMVFHVGGKTHLLRETMVRLEARLDPKRFIRIHRSTIVNIDRVRKLSPSFVGEYVVVLNDGTKLKLSRGYHERLQSVLKHTL